jgi:uncharacterized protein (TIGR00661 family)
LQKLFFHKKILIVPLDWGLGHTTRCISLIRYLLQIGCEIIVAGSPHQLLLLNQEFPNITVIKLTGYRITYSKQKRWLPIKILWQTPKILLSIRRENKWLQKIINKLKIDAVISDNRFGLYTKQVACVFITHQLLVKAPYRWLENFLQKINYKYINRYSECWIPDVKDQINIAGELSHPGKFPSIPVKYIGPLSRFEGQPTNVKRFDYLFVTSGPEPQRTVFEEKIFDVIPKLHGSMMLVRGKPGESKSASAGLPNCDIKTHVSTEELQELLEQSEFVISRCGYTTVMELLSLKKKSVLIPTPGQTEQEYLAKHLMQQQWCYCCNQDEDLLEHLQKAKNFEFKFFSFESGKLEEVVNDFLNRLK